MNQDAIDARRYRWLRDAENAEAVSSMIAILDYGDDACLINGAELDAEIDAAMEPRYTITPAGRAMLEGK